MATQKTNSSNATQDFQALSIDHTKISKAAFLRAHYEEIESAIKSGVKIKDIISVFQKNKIEITVTTFNQYIYRERKKRLKEKNEIIAKPFVEKEKPVNLNLDAEKQEAATEPVKKWKSAYSKSDPRMIDEIFNEKVDLDDLAKAYKERKRKGNI